MEDDGRPLRRKMASEHWTGVAARLHQDAETAKAAASREILELGNQLRDRTAELADAKTDIDLLRKELTRTKQRLEQESNQRDRLKDALREMESRLPHSSATEHTSEVMSKLMRDLGAFRASVVVDEDGQPIANWSTEVARWASVLIRLERMALRVADEADRVISQLTVTNGDTGKQRTIDQIDLGADTRSFVQAVRVLTAAVLAPPDGMGDPTSYSSALAESFTAIPKTATERYAMFLNKEPFAAILDKGLAKPSNF